MFCALASPYFTAVGFVVSMNLKFWAIVAFALSLLIEMTATVWLRCLFPTRSRPLPTAAIVSIAIGIILPCIYGSVVAIDVELLTIPWMARSHGTLNAIGFVGCGLRAVSMISEARTTRLYVKPNARRGQLERLLAERVVALARDGRYKKMRLDTLASMTPAIALYKSVGVVEIPAYCHNPIDGARYFQLDL